MFSAVASGIFAARNVDKTANGDVGRSAVALGQTAGLVQEVAKYDNLVSKGARSALSVFSDMAKENKAFEYAGKVTKFAVNNVNPLICASGVLKTAMSDDKVKTGIVEVAALSTMFMAEACVKHNYDRAVNSNTVSKVLKSDMLKPAVKFLEKHKWAGKAGNIIKGLTFVAASMTAYSAGQKVGEDVADKVKAELKIPKKINQKA